MTINLRALTYSNYYTKEVITMIFRPNPYRHWPHVPPPYPRHYGQHMNPHLHSIIDQFRKEDGTFDYEKIVNHGGQIISIVNQAKPLVKQMKPLLSLFKNQE